LAIRSDTIRIENSKVKCVLDIFRRFCKKIVDRTSRGDFWIVSATAMPYKQQYGVPLPCTAEDYLIDVTTLSDRLP
jgi:hypothetical protein